MDAVIFSDRVLSHLERRERRRAALRPPAELQARIDALADRCGVVAASRVRTALPVVDCVRPYVDENTVEGRALLREALDVADAYADHLRAVDSSEIR